MNNINSGSLHSSPKLKPLGLEIPDRGLGGRSSPNKQRSLNNSPTSSKPPDKNTKWRFVLFLLSNLLINYDGGVIPASLIQIESELHITYTQEAALGSLVYVGLSAASLFVSGTFKKYQVKNVLAFMMFMKAIFCGLFSYFSDLMILYACRIMMGITQAFCVIYAPVWVNEFSPKDNSTTWMGLLHAFVPIGIMLGFVVAALAINIFPGFVSWRFAIQLQAICEVPVALLFFLQDNKNIDVLYDQKNISSSAATQQKNVRIDTISYDNFKNIFNQVRMLLENKTLILTSLSLCSLYYVVTGIQYWSSLYMIRILEMSPHVAVMSFGLIAITAPLAGVFVGGATSDSLGGYKGDNLLTAVKLCSAYAIVAFLVSMPLSSVTKLWFFLPLLWTLLFFGACIIPIATGITVDCVPRANQADNSSFSQLLYNIFGYFLAPVLSAIIMDRFSDSEEGLIWGFRSVLWFSLFGVIFILINWRIVSKDIETYREMKEDLDPQIKGMSKAEINLEVARRRAATLL